MTRRVTILFSAPLLVLLAGCTPLGQFLGSGEGGAVTAPTASATPSPSATPDPGPTTGSCDDAVLTERGEYHLPDCVRVTIQGQDIQVNAGDIQTLIITGNANEVDAGNVGSVSVTGNVNEIDTLDAGSVDLDGNYNDVGVHGSVDKVGVDGDDNEVLADGDVGAVENRGQRNVIGSQP